jgi:hypothetical protein
MWQRRSPHGQRSKVQGHETRGSTGARLDREARSGAVRHVGVSEPISIGRLGSGLQGTWQCVDVCTAPFLDLKPVYGVLGTDIFIKYLIILLIFKLFSFKFYGTFDHLSYLKRKNNIYLVITSFITRQN